MTVNLNTYSDISSFVNTIYEDAVLIARDNNVMSQLVTTFGDRTGAAVRSNQRYSSATMNTVGESDDLTSQAFTPSAIATLTPAEKAAQFFLTDLLVESDPFGVRQMAAMELGQAIATDIETSILSNFNAMAAGTIGASGSVLTWNYFYAMLSVLRNAKAPMPYNFVCTPYQWYRLGIAASVGATVTNDPATQERFGANFYVGNVAGVRCFVTANCETSSTDAYAGLFSQPALALDIRRAPRLEYERDASRRGWELNLSAVYAHGVWRPEWGVCGYFANSAVTGE